MMCKTGTRLLLLMLISNVISLQTIYITPENEKDRCKNFTECYTLTELSKQNLASNITLNLNFFSGEHSLNWNMAFNGSNVTLQAHMEGYAIIKCYNYSAGISVNNSEFASIEKLKFSGCTSNTLISVNRMQYFYIRETHFTNNSCENYVLSIINT